MDDAAKGIRAVSHNAKEGRALQMSNPVGVRTVLAGRCGRDRWCLNSGTATECQSATNAASRPLDLLHFLHQRPRHSYSSRFKRAALVEILKLENLRKYKYTHK